MFKKVAMGYNYVMQQPSQNCFMSFLGAPLLTCAAVAVVVAGSCPQAELGLCLGRQGAAGHGEAGARSASAAALEQKQKSHAGFCGC